MVVFYPYSMLLKETCKFLFIDLFVVEENIRNVLDKELKRKPKLKNLEIQMVNYFCNVI